MYCLVTLKLFLQSGALATEFRRLLIKFLIAAVNVRRNEFKGFCRDNSIVHLGNQLCEDRWAPACLVLAL